PTSVAFDETGAAHVGQLPVFVLAEHGLPDLAKILLKLVHRVGPRQPTAAASRPRRGAARAEDRRVLVQLDPEPFDVLAEDRCRPRPERAGGRPSRLGAVENENLPVLVLRAPDQAWAAARRRARASCRTSARGPHPVGARKAGVDGDRLVCHY